MDEDGYETDVTIPDNEYDFETEQKYLRKQEYLKEQLAKKRKAKSQERPRTPPRMTQYSEEPTELRNPRNNQKLFAKVVENGKLKFIIYTTDHAKLERPMYDQDGKQLIPEELFPIGFESDGGGASKSRRRSIKKRTSRRRKSKRSRRRRKTTRRYRK